VSRNYKSTDIRQKQIADAASKVIIKYGSEHVTVKRIAKEVGISETAIYRHFNSKREILSFLISDIEKNLLSEIKLNIANKLLTFEALENVFQEHMNSIVQRRGVSFQIISEIISLGSKKLNKQVYNVINKYIEGIKYILEAGYESGVIKKDIDLDATALLFYGMVQGLVNIWALCNYDFDAEERFLALWNTYKKLF
jgi:TetR/AcrR family transcriptional regulator, fatty acid metabolism regulator protein